MAEILSMFLKLVFAHLVCDYPLQGDFLARAKNHRAPLPGVPWWQALFAHVGIHGGAVWLLTGSLPLAWFEIGTHALIDHAKCEGGISFNRDQACHLIFKALWAGAWYAVYVAHQ